MDKNTQTHIKQVSICISSGCAIIIIEVDESQNSQNSFEMNKKEKQNDHDDVSTSSCSTIYNNKLLLFINKNNEWKISRRKPKIYHDVETKMKNQLHEENMRLKYTQKKAK